MDGDQYVCVVDDDAAIRDSLRELLEANGFKARSFRSAREFLEDDMVRPGCLIADIRMPDMNGLELQAEIVRRQMDLAVIIMTGHSDMPLVMRAMRAGAIDFLEKPFNSETLLDSVRRALTAGSRARGQRTKIRVARALLASLTPREHSVLDKIVMGCPTKVAAHELGISPRTVETHRAHIMNKMNVSNMPDLVRAVVAGGE